MPKEQYWQFLDKSWAKYDNDTLIIYLSNPLRCPLRFKITSTDAALSERLKPVQNVMLAFAKDTLIKVHATQKQAESVLIHHALATHNRK